MHHAQAEQLLEWFEVAVAVQERMTVAETECRDETVNGLANGASLRSESAVIPGRSHSELNTTSLEDFEASQILQHANGFFIGRETLQDLAEHQVEQAKRLPGELLVQPIRLACRDSVEVINPNGGVNDNHGISWCSRRVRAGSRSDRRAR